MKAQKILDNIYNVGAKDYSLKTFHGYDISNGVTYNAFLIIDEKIVLIDTVEKDFTDEMISRIESVVQVEKIDIIISNHAEYDHSGGIKEVYTRAKNAVIYATGAGIKTLTNLYGEMNYKLVKTGDTINTGKYNFQFYQTPMVHWPDNMVTYLVEESILFSNDALGQHYATKDCLDYENDKNLILYEAKHYYANIVQPYRVQTKKALEAIKNINPKIIAPSHGVVLINYVSDMVKLYEEMTAVKKEDKAIVVYDSMWGNTMNMSKKIGSRLEETYSKVLYFDLKDSKNSEIVTELLDAKVLALGSPTLNNGMMPLMSAFLCYIQGLQPVDVSYITFGSHGWAGGALKKMEIILDEMKFTKIGSVSTNYSSDSYSLAFLDKIK